MIRGMIIQNSNHGRKYVTTRLKIIMKIRPALLHPFVFYVLSGLEELVKSMNYRYMQD
jgi:hypothetical protein